MRRRISGRAAASSERTWTASRTEPGWTRASAAGRRVIVSSAAVSRTIGPCRSASRARCSAWRRGDDGDAALGRGQIGLGRLDPRRQRRARRAGAVGLAGGAARLLIERLVMLRRLGRLAPRFGERGGVAFARRLRRPGDGEEQGDDRKRD